MYDRFTSPDYFPYFFLFLSKAASHEKYSTALLVQHRAVWRNQFARLAQKAEFLHTQGLLFANYF